MDSLEFNHISESSSPYTSLGFDYHVDWFFKILSLYYFTKCSFGFFLNLNRNGRFFKARCYPYILLHCSNIFLTIISFELSTDTFTISQTENYAVKEEMDTSNIQGQSHKLITLNLFFSFHCVTLEVKTASEPGLHLWSGFHSSLSFLAPLLIVQNLQLYQLFPVNGSP